ncbi:MAG TPA: ABC transporter permease subunit [Candidatus Sulfobium mesophilum]|nr:ABC transporter permease subunit [Candidatus Sulfobium mesophilum]
MLQIFLVTFKGILRDRVFRGIMMAGILFPLIPSISSLSMRQVTELSISLSLSLISFILLLLSIFLGGTSLWRDIERRYTFSVLSLPLNRASYVLGKFFGIAGFIILTTFVLALISSTVILSAAGNYPPLRPIVWPNIVLSFAFCSLKYILVIAVSFLISAVSTSFFLPIFGTICFFIVGSATQEVYDYLHSSVGHALSPVVRNIANTLYYILPNFSAFDFEVNAVYGVSPSLSGMIWTCVYFAIYTSILLTLSTIVFSRREMQ